MALILFRDLPGIAEIERSLQLLEENKLMKPEIDELEARLDDKSIELFGISGQQTSYWDAKPDVRAAMTHEEFEELFTFLEWEWIWDEEPAYWAAFGLDVRNEHGDRLASIDYFGRQIVCAVRRLHPSAYLTFAETQPTDQQICAAAEAWGRRLMRRKLRR